MDELDKAAISIFRNSSRRSIHLYGPFQRNRLFVESGQWVELWSDCREIPFGGHFLSLNIRYGVIPSVEPRATPRCLIQKGYVSDGLDLSDGLQPDSFQFVTTQLYPLILDPISYDINSVYADSVSVPNPDMVACLVRKGASFDWACQPNQLNHHLWRQLLRSILNCWDDEEILMKWMKIAELALQNGSPIPSESSMALLLPQDVLNTPDEVRALLVKLESVRCK